MEYLVFVIVFLFVVFMLSTFYLSYRVWSLKSELRGMETLLSLATSVKMQDEDTDVIYEDDF